MPIVSAPTSPVITPPAAQPAAPADAAAPAGAAHDGRRVSAGAAQGPIAPALAGAAPAPSAAPARTVAPPPGAAVNRAGEPRRPDRLRASLLQRLARHVRESFDKLVARFRQRNSQDARASAPARSVPMAARVAEASVSGINAGRRNFQTHMQGAGRDPDQVRDAFLSGDMGLRRATTGLQAMAGQAPLPGGGTAHLGEQLEAVSGLARRLCKAQFSAAVPANFLQYGNKGDTNPYHEALLGEQARLEPRVRAWVGEGLDLAQQLADACQRACPMEGEPQAPFAEGELEALQRRVDAFADATARSAAPEPEPAVGEYLGFPEETIEWMKEYNQPAAAPDTSAQAAQDKLPKNFNVDEFVARLDQELAMQDEQIRSHEQQLESDPALARDQEAVGLLKRMSAERDARSLTRAEALAGRNPLPALYAQAGKLDAAGDRAGAAAYTGWARKAFSDTAEYLAGSGNELLRNVRPERVESLADLGIADIEAVELMILDGKTPRTIDFRGLSRQWGAAADRIGAQSVQTYPQGPVEIERANDVSHVEGYMLQAVAQLNQGLDPRQDLLRHAQDLENKEYADGGRLVRIPQELRTMAAQYEALLQENLGYRAGADWLDQVRSLRETARQEP